MKLLWLEDEQWWGKRYITRLYNIDVMVFENPKKDAEPTAIIKEDGVIYRVKIGKSVEALIEAVETHLLGNKNERAAA